MPASWTVEYRIHAGNTPHLDTFRVFMLLHSCLEQQHILPGDNPSDSEESKKDVTAMLEAGVLQKFGELQQVVGAVVHQDHKGAHLLQQRQVKT